MEFLVKTWALNITMNMRAKLIYFYIGIDGDNGKSTVRKILAALCGDFASSLNKDLLVGRGGEAGKATTQLQSLVKSRLSMSDELGHNDVIHCAKLKEVTGQTPMSFRGLYKMEQRKFIHSCTLMLNSNSLPKFDELDGPTKNRLCIVPCEKQQKDNPDLSLRAVDCVGNRYLKQLKRDPDQAQLLLQQNGLDALFTIL